MNLRPYQKEALQKLRESISMGNKKILLSAATGAGKSIIIKTIFENAIKKNPNGKFLYIVHREILIKQMKETLLGLNVEIMTLQKAGKEDTIKYDLVLSDETHFGHGSKLFSRINYKHFIGLTATPIDSKGYALTGYDDIVSVAELIDLIELGYMPPLNIIGMPSVKTDNLKSTGGDFDKREAFKLLDKSVVYEDIFKAFENYALNMKTIIYCVNVEHSEKVSQEFKEKNISCESFHSKKPKKERDQILNDFKNNKIQVLTNAEILTTGLDMPDVYCLILAAPTKSYTKAIQIYGRIRLNPNDRQKKGLILDLAEVIKNTQHPLQRLDLSKQKKQEGHKCKKCNDIMKLVKRETKELNKYEYIVISSYMCDCGHSDQIQTPKTINYEICEKCGNHFESVGGLKIDDSKNLTFNLECIHCGHNKKFREIIYTKKELEEITLENAKAGHTWEDVMILLKRACKENGFHHRYALRLEERLKNKRVEPNRAIKEIVSIMKRKKRISSLMYANL